MRAGFRQFLNKRQTVMVGGSTVFGIHALMRTLRKKTHSTYTFSEHLIVVKCNYILKTLLRLNCFAPTSELSESSQFEQQNCFPIFLLTSTYHDTLTTSALLRGIGLGQMCMPSFDSFNGTFSIIIFGGLLSS